MCDSCDCQTRDTAGATDGTAPVNTVYQVDGMTCGHCESAVSTEIGRIDGVTGVQVDLGTGRVTVSSATPLDESTVRAAVDEAGYALTGTL